MTDAVALTLYGMTDIAGSTVAAFLTGLDCGDYIVASDGSITVPFGADADALFTIARCQAAHAVGGWGILGTKVDIYVSGATHSYTIPCAVGFTYTSQGQVLRPAAEAEIKSPHGSGLAKNRRVHQIGVLVSNSIGVSYGTEFAKVLPAIYRDAGGTIFNHATMFSGVYWDTVPDEYSFDGAVCWQITRPYPTVIVSLTGFMKLEDRG